MDRTQFHLQKQIDHLYAQKPRQLAFRAQSVEAFDAWKRSLRGQVADILGIAGRRLPASVAVDLIETIDRGQFVEEKYAMDVGEIVPAPLYILVPKTKPPYKAILAFHGHSTGARSILSVDSEDESPDDGNRYARALAQAGYLVAAVEQRGFGERLSDQTHPPPHHNSCRHLSFEYLMQGRTMVGERCWDGMVAISYLQTRDDVAPDGVGCVGFSGGGTTTLWLSALDDRISVSVPSSYFCSFKHSILGVPHCECNYVPRILDYAEMGDLAALIAPRPFCAVTGEHDPIFPIAGARQEFETVKRAYDLLGASDRCSLVVHLGGHVYDHAASAEWLAAWL